MKPETKNLAEFAEDQAGQRLKTFSANLRLVAKHPGKAGPIHDLRVSIRRLTQALRVFRDLWNPDHYRKMRRKLRVVMDRCAAVRNCDVAMEVLAAAGAPAVGGLKRYLRKRRSHAERDLSERLGHWKSQGTVKPWRHWLRARGGKNRSIQARMRQTLRPLTLEFKKAGSQAAQPKTSPDQLHQLRLLSKRLRYSLEIFGSLSGGDWEQEIDRIREVQDLLGSVNDCVTSSVLISEYGPDESKATLTHLLDARLETFRKRWREVYDSSKKRRID